MKKNIYVLEDDADIRDLISLILIDDLYEVRTCASVREFTELMSHSRPDVVVLDIMLPDGNGLDLCREMKERQATASIPIVLMSAHQRSEDALSEGCAEAFISKPFNIDSFKQKVESYLN